MKRVLIANRGEIAVRVARGCQLLGLEAVAVFSDADATARHVRQADCAVHVGPAAAAESYLRIDKLMTAAKLSCADAVHPGYGFLSESVELAQAVIDAGMTWIGPPPSAILPLASKTEAKRIAIDAGVPTAPAMTLEDDDPATLQKAADTVGFPMLVKPEFGGGGKGMQRVDAPEQLATAVAAARRVSKAAFASDRIFVERFVENARHVEVQVLADTHGDVRHVFERECSLQRRHQKVVEEAPCPVLSDDERAALCQSGAAFAAGIGYQGAGTVEFLFDPVRREHYFLEMNTRLQVEHPVTEMVCGVDLVAAQLEIAQGRKLAEIPPFSQGVEQRGHSVEARIYAEDPAGAYLPQVGVLRRCRWPDGPFVRVDTGYAEGDEVGMHYDPMLAKVIVWGADREAARKRLIAALRRTVIHGLVTNVPMLLAILEHEATISARMSTSTLDELYGGEGPGMDATPDETALLAIAGAQAGSGAVGPVTAAAERSPWTELAGFRVGEAR